MGFTRGLGTELVKTAAFVAALAVGANFHEPLAQWAARLPLPERAMPTLTYLAIIVLALWVGRVLNQALIVKLLKREKPGSSPERLLGATVGFGRGVLAVGAILLLLLIPPWGAFADYVGASVYERSATGAKAVDASRWLIERAANVIPGSAYRSELYPFAS